MPFVANTPESLLGRADSRNPNTTCRGITSSGRPCRRPVSPGPKAGQSEKLSPPSFAPAEGSFCWQHRDQVLRGARSSPAPRTAPLYEDGAERSSIDTLADRMGLLDVDDARRGRKNNSNAGESEAGHGRHEETRITMVTCCFCFSIPVEETVPQPAPARPQPRPIQGRTSVAVPAGGGRPPHGASRRPQQQQHSAPAAVSASPGKNKPEKSQAADFLRFILPTTGPQAASALMTELARPFVDSEEPGYIYMFWMTPESKADPPVEAARSLLAPPPSPGQSRRSRRPSDVVSRYAEESSAGGGSPGGDSRKRAAPSKKKKMLLKIGRAANVQRRMNQWSRQCGYSVEVLRFYPYVPSASAASSADLVPRMTPHCHRVERLVHIELRGMGLRVPAETCDACGREHREWFEVDAARDDVRAVDEVIRRWIEWDESQV